jgi:hypothetical protein
MTAHGVLRPAMAVLAGLTLAGCAANPIDLALPDLPPLSFAAAADGSLQARFAGGPQLRLSAPTVRIREGGRWRAADARLQTATTLGEDGLLIRPVWQRRAGDGPLEGVEWTWRLTADGGIDDPRWTQLGYAKFSPAGVARITGPLPRDGEGALAPGLDDPALGVEPIIRGVTPDPQRGWWSTTIRATADTPLVGVGACSAKRWKTRLAAGRAADGSLEIVLAQGTPGDPLPTTATTALETICLGAGRFAEDVEAALAEYFDSGWTPRPAQPAPRFFSTWHADFFRLDLAAIERELAALAASGYDRAFDAFQLDDGWQPRWGDWQRTREGFGADLTATAARIRAAGYRPGIWLTPSVADPRAEVLVRHPDWVLRDAAGRTVSCGLCSVPYPDLVALDWSRPAVAEWFAGVLAGLQAAGFRMFKLDFLAYSAAEGLGFDPSMTALDRYRTMMETVRGALLPDSLAWTATQPLWPSLGAFDGNRVAADLGFEFFEELPTTNRMMYLRALGLRGGWLSRFGLIDPDAFFARNQPSRAAREGLAALTAMAGSMYSIGERPADLDDSLRPDRLPAALGAAIGSGEPFRPADPLGRPADPWVPFAVVEAFLGYDAWLDAQDLLWWRRQGGRLDLVVLRLDTGTAPLEVDLAPVLARLAGEGRSAALVRSDGGPEPTLQGSRLRIDIAPGAAAVLRLTPQP